MPIGLPADAASLRKYSTCFVAYGVVLIALGVFAIAAPNVATLAVELVVGWLLTFGGLFGIAAIITGGTSTPGFWWNLLTSFVFLLAGVALLTRPMSGIVTLTIILAAYLLAGGVARIMMAFNLRASIPGAWVWILISGLVDIVLALMIVSGMPGTAGWVLGLLVGINLLMAGIALVIASFGIRKMTPTGVPA